MSATPTDAQHELDREDPTPELSIDLNRLPIVNLRNPTLAALLAWLVPGLGHAYQGRYFKAALFFICIFGTFMTGVCLGGSPTRGYGRVVYVEAKGKASSLFARLPFLCQAAAGVVAMPAIVQTYRASKDPVVRQEYMYPPLNEDELNSLHFDLGRYFELGVVYTMIAGLLNILAIYDAYGGPVYIVDEDKPNDDAAKNAAKVKKSPEPPASTGELEAAR